MVAEGMFPEADGTVTYGIRGDGGGDAHWGRHLNDRLLFEREGPPLPRAALAFDASTCEDGWFVTDPEEQEGSDVAQPTTLKVSVSVYVRRQETHTPRVLPFGLPVCKTPGGFDQRERSEFPR